MYQWAIIGAGPAGIAATAKLLDSGIPSQEILWIDPQFTVGDFGTIWRNVPSNTRVNLFLKFLHALPAFDFKNCEQDFAINQLDPTETCALHYMADPLQWITNHLMKKVNVIRDKANLLTQIHDGWEIKFNAHDVVQAKHIILANGAEPKTLTHANLPTIPLQDAMDYQRIKNYISHDDTIAVFGSSHSAILIIKYLLEYPVKRVINLYRSPLLYAIPKNGWILYDDTGLKGTTAEWARAHIDRDLPKNLIRVYSDDENIARYLPTCQKACYAIGFEKREIKIVKKQDQMIASTVNGVIAPGLFGFGIAYPEPKRNPEGLLEFRVGLWKFMEYLQEIMPMWLNNNEK